MLQSLKVKNYALIEDVEIRFDKGLNIITGETGAGKSILIGALGLVLGNRADSSVLKNREKKCIIEAVFDVSSYNLRSVFKNADLDYEDQSILRREITVSGKSRSFLNDTPVNLKTLDMISKALIEVHSQHDNLQLFQSSFQFTCLDVLAGLQADASSYLKDFRTWQEQVNELKVLEETDAQNKRENDFNQFLYNELEEAGLQEGEEKALTEEQELLENAEELIQSLKMADELLSASENSALQQLREVQRLLQQNSTEMTREWSERLKSCMADLDDLAFEISKDSAGIQVDPQRLEEVNDRLGLIFQLRKKHHVQDESELLRIKEDLENKLESSSSLSERIEALRKELEQNQALLEDKALQIHKKRIELADSIANRINTDLEQLGMQHSRLRFRLERSEKLGVHGFSILELELSSDKGKTFNAIGQSASGGELSRINLSLRSLIAGHLNLPSAVFDEIDTGVSGEIARKVGAKMLAMSAEQQVIVITHLVQIASLGQRHFHIYKEEEGAKIITRVKTLNEEERIHEIARMISGDNLTDSALEQSRSLLMN